MKRKYGIIFGAVAIALLMISSATAVTIPQSNENNGKSATQQSEDNTLASQGCSLEKLLSTFNINMDTTTMGKFKQILYSLASDESLGDLTLVAQLKKDVNDLYVILDQMGVTSDMTIKKAKTIIDINKEPLTSSGFNLFCSIDVYGIGTTTHLMRIGFAIRDRWGFVTGEYGHATIDGLIGLQNCEGTVCGGTVLGLLGISATGFWEYGCVATIDAFALYSRSNVPFKGGSISINQPITQSSL